MALPRVLAAFLLLGSLFHTARAETLVTSGTYTWTSSTVGQVEVTVRVYRDVTGHPGLLKWDYEIHNISMHNYYEPCYAYPTMDEGIGEFTLWFPASIPTTEINEETLTLPEGWEYWPIYDGENYTAIVGFSLGAVESANIIEAGESAHVTFLTEPRAIEELDGGAAGAPWVACAMKVRSLGRKSPTVKSKEGARRLELPENWAGGNIMAPGELFGVTITGDEGVPADDGQNEFQVTMTYPSPSDPVTLQLSTTEGEGSATFSDGQTTKTIENSQTVAVHGRLPSTTAGNILLAAKRLGQTLAQKSFSVVKVQLSMRSDSGLQVSGDNAKTQAYIDHMGGSWLGPGVTAAAPKTCSLGVEIVGQVTPSNYRGKITLVRHATGGAGYENSTEIPQASLPPHSGLVPGPDTSYPEYMDKDPAPNGRVYDLDAPGMGATGQAVWRYRANFHQWAVLGDSVSGKRVSESFLWFARESCRVGPSGELLFDISLAGDNKAGPGLTMTTWDFQD